MLTASSRDDFLTRRRPKGGAVLTSEGVSLSVLTSLRSRRADKLPKAACCAARSAALHSVEGAEAAVHGDDDAVYEGGGRAAEPDESAR